MKIILNILILLIVGVIHLIITEKLINYIEKERLSDDKIENIVSSWNRVKSIAESHMAVMLLSMVLFSGAGFIVNGLMIKLIFSSKRKREIK